MASVKKPTTPVVVPITSQKDCKACQGQHRKHTCGKDTTGLPAVSPSKNTNVKLPDWDAIKKQVLDLTNQVAEKKGTQQTEASAGPGSTEVTKVPDTSVSDVVPAPPNAPAETEPQADMMPAALRRLH